MARYGEEYSRQREEWSAESLCIWDLKGKGWSLGWVQKGGSPWRDSKVMKENSDVQQISMIWPWRYFVSPEMLSKPVPHTLGGENIFSMTVPFLGRFHREQATSYLWPSCSNISPGLCSSSFGNHRYYLPRHRNVHSTWSNGGTEPKSKVSAVCLLV